MSRYYDKYKRDQKARAFYKSVAWQKARELALVRDSYMCQRCLRNKRVTKANVVHHIKELRDYPDLALELDNLESLCHSCHTRHHKTGKEMKEDIEVEYLEMGANEELV